MAMPKATTGCLYFEFTKPANKFTPNTLGNEGLLCYKPNLIPFSSFFCISWSTTEGAIKDIVSDEVLAELWSEIFDLFTRVEIDTLSIKNSYFSSVLAFFDDSDELVGLRVAKDPSIEIEKSQNIVGEDGFTVEFFVNTQTERSGIFFQPTTKGTQQIVEIL